MLVVKPFIHVIDQHSKTNEVCRILQKTFQNAYFFMNSLLHKRERGETMFLTLTTHCAADDNIEFSEPCSYFSELPICSRVTTVALDLTVLYKGTCSPAEDGSLANVMPG